jgi:obg-like ATPase 1
MIDRWFHRLPRPSFFLLTRPFSVSAQLQAKKKMPPKKAAQEKKVLLGRPSNNLKIGIVGAPTLPYNVFKNQ